MHLYFANEGPPIRQCYGRSKSDAEYYWTDSGGVGPPLDHMRQECKHGLVSWEPDEDNQDAFGEPFYFRFGQSAFAVEEDK